jgi:hypothetical protein
MRAPKVLPRAAGNYPERFLGASWKSAALDCEESPTFNYVTKISEIILDNLFVLD